MKENDYSKIIKPGFETLDEVLKNLEKSRSCSSIGYSSRQTFYSSSINDENASLGSEASYIRHSTPKSRSNCSNKEINDDNSIYDDDDYYDSNHKIIDNDFNKIIGRMFSASKISQNNNNQMEDLESISSGSRSRYKKAVSFNLSPEDLDETYTGEEELESDLNISKSYKILDKLTDEFNGTFDKINNKQQENSCFKSGTTSDRKLESFITEDFDGKLDKITKNQQEKINLHSYFNSEPWQSKTLLEPFTNQNITAENQLFKENSDIFLDKLADCINKKNVINMNYMNVHLGASNLNSSEVNNLKINNYHSKNEKFSFTQSSDSFSLNNDLTRSFQNKNLKEVNDILRLKDSYLNKNTESLQEEKDLNSTFSNTNISLRSANGLFNSKSENHLAKLNSSTLKSPILREDYMSLNFLPDKPNFAIKFDESKKLSPLHMIKEAYSDSNIKEKLKKIYSEIQNEKINQNKTKEIFSGGLEKESLTNSNLFLDEPLTSKYNLDSFLLKDFSSTNEQASYEENLERSKKVTFKLTKAVPALNVKNDIEEGLKKNLKPLGYGLLIMDLSKIAEKNINVSNQNLILNKSKKFILKNVPIFKKDVESYSPIKRIEIYS